MNNNKEWSKEEIEILKKNYKKYSNSELSKIFLPNRSVDSISNKAKTLNLSKEDKSWSYEEITILKENYATCSMDELKELLKGRTEKTIRTTASKLNLKKASIWNDEEINFIRNNYEYLGARGCLRKMRDEIHNEWQVKRLAKELKLSFKGNRTKPWTVEDDKYLKELWDTNAPNKYELAIEKLGRSKQAIKQRIIALNKKK